MLLNDIYDFNQNEFFGFFLNLNKKMIWYFIGRPCCVSDMCLQWWRYVTFYPFLRFCIFQSNITLTFYLNNANDDSQFESWTVAGMNNQLFIFHHIFQKMSIYFNITILTFCLKFHGDIYWLKLFCQREHVMVKEWHQTGFSPNRIIK